MGKALLVLEALEPCEDQNEKSHIFKRPVDMAVGMTGPTTLVGV